MLVLDDGSFDQAVKEFDYLLVEFYAPWCGHCQKLAPEYAKSAGVLKSQNSPIRLAKVDATTNPLLSSRFEATSFPTIKFFHYGSPRVYNGGRIEEEITAWLQEAVKSRMTKLASEEELRKVLKEKGIAAVVFAKEGSEAAHAVEIASIVSKSSDYYWLPTSDDTETPSTLIVYNQKENSEFTFIGPWSEKPISDFVKDSKIPLVMSSSHVGLEFAVQKHKPVVFIFKPDSDNDSLFSTLLEVAKLENNEVRFCVGSVKDEGHSSLADFFGILEEGKTTAVLFDTQAKPAKKYKYTESSMDVLGMRVFLEKWRKQLLTPFYKSEKEPEKQEIVLHLTTDNYDDMVRKNAMRGLMVFFYTPWCLRCQDIDLGHILHDFGTKFRLGKIDVMKNELPWMDLPLYPGIYWYQNNQPPVIYEGNYSMESINQWITTDLQIEPIQRDEEEKEKKEEEVPRTDL